MGYQALLFCPDEKLSGVVSQVFAELDFTIDPVHEPFAAVKKLMAQHYDAIVFDSENEQNASLLFRSVRNSSSNQSSLAIALVEGQAGIAKAYRIGANLVLTKPINVEQAKGTLRVARGLLRKASESARAAAASSSSPSMTASPTPAAAGSVQPTYRNAPATASASNYSQSHDLETPLPAVVSEAVPAESLRKAASATIDDKPALAPAADRTTHPTNKVIDSNAVDTNVKNAVTSETGISLVNSGSVPTPNIISAMPSSTGSATAPAPAKEVISPQSGKNRIVDAEPAESSHANPTHDGHSIPNFSSVRGSNTPSFAALSGEDDSGASYANKKMLIAAVIVLSLAALGYLGYGMLGKSGAPIAPPSASQPHDSKRPEPTPAPISTPETAPDKPQSSTENPPATRIATDKAPHNELETKKPDSSPLRVKPNVGETETPAQSDEPQLPGSSALASANENSLSGVMSASSPGVPKLSLTSIKISQGVSEGLLIKRVQPRYPQSALAAHAQGAVQIEATVNKEGFVTNPRVLQGDPVLARAALDAVRQWRYKPYYLDGQPVEIQTQITVKFKAN